MNKLTCIHKIIGQKIYCFILVLLVLASGCGQNNEHESSVANQQSNLKSVVVAFAGGTHGLDPEMLAAGLFKEESHMEGYFPLELQVVTTEDSFNTNDITNVMSAYESVMLKIVVRHGEDAKLNPVAEIAQRSYEHDVQRLIHFAAKKTSDLLEHASQRYEGLDTSMFGIGRGCYVLLETLRQTNQRVDAINCFYPTMALAQSTTFIDALRKHGYTRNEVKVIAYKDDPTIPHFERMMEGNFDVLRFIVVERAN